MTHEDARRLLDRIGVLNNACDLDLLVFFARHPRSLLASESLASFLGYDLKQIADSLETLLAAGLLTRTQTTAHAARLYVFALEATNGDWLPPLVERASTREGRLALRQALPRGRRDAASESAQPIKHDSVAHGPRRLVASLKRRTGTE